jgi:PKD repeat protein
MRYAFAILLAMLAFAPACQAAWFDSNWTCRRSLQIVWDDQNATGNDLASCVFYTDGHALPNGEDVRVTTEEGKLLPSHVLMVGPGDRIRVVFAMMKGVRNYDIYFGNPSPPPPPAGFDDVKYKCGLLLETRQWSGGAVTNFKQIEQSFERSKPVLGKMMIDQVFLGYNPFGPQEQWISKFSGEITAPQEDDYFFAVAADDAGALYIDGKPLVFAPLGGADIRYHGTVHLTAGPHEFVAYHANFAGTGYISVGWRRVSQPKIEIIHREAFGVCFSGAAGPLEIHNKTLVADFAINQQGECFFADGYSYHFRFTPRTTLANADKFDWDFGDGQRSDKKEVDHVYLTDGIYPVKLTAHIGANTDTQTVQLAVNRNWAHIMDSRQDQPQILSGLVQSYDVKAIAPANLPRIVQLFVTADDPVTAVGFAQKLAGMKSHPDSAAAFAALYALEKKLIATGKADAAAEIWDRVPADADIQPFAARRGAEMALWWTGDVAKAVHLLQPFAKSNDPGLRRQYAQALALSGKLDEAKKLFDAEPSNVPPARRVALSGAAARNVEFFITSNDPESGEEAWERWQAKFPSDFLEGYSVMLRTKLMEQRKRGAAAASIAEAFANAVPLSPYAPQLLDRASKLLASTDAAKSQALRQQLKQKYPEDPLSQD